MDKKISLEQLRDLLICSRSVRRFKEDRTITAEDLRSLVELARFCPSGRNAQPLRYRLVTEAEEREAIFPALAWAGYFKDWAGPQEGERPAAYLVQCLDTRLGNDCLCDDGLQLEAITLGAATRGLGCCIIKAFNASDVAQALGIDPRFKPRYVLALGVPAERVVLEDMTGNDDADFKYFRTPDGIHHVPKRPLEELIIQ